MRAILNIHLTATAIMILYKAQLEFSAVWGERLNTAKFSRCSYGCVELYFPKQKCT